MKNAGLADEVLGVVGEEVALARDHRGGDRALVPSDDPVDPRRKTVARMIDRGAEALAEARVARRRQNFNRAERRADRADAGEERVAGEIVAARQHRMRRRQEPRLQRHEVAGDDVRRRARRHANAARDFLSRHAVGVAHGDHHARSDGPEIHLLDIALQGHDADAVEDRRGDPQGAQRHRQKSGEEGDERQRQAERQGPRAGE